MIRLFAALVLTLAVGILSRQLRATVICILCGLQ